LIVKTAWNALGKGIGGCGGDAEMEFSRIKISFSSPYLLRIPPSPFKKMTIL
jgi:hypothetical protein